MTCRVKGCRYPNSHTTKGHLCSSCNKYGHGRMECGKKHNLHIYYHETLPIEMQCTMRGCKYKMYHNNDSHHCPHCFLNHAVDECPKVGFTLNQNIKIKCPICRTDNELDTNKIKNHKHDICCVCMNKKAIIMFPKCSHVCCCLDCVKKMDNNKDSDNLDLFNQILDENQMKLYCDLDKIKKEFKNSKHAKLSFIAHAGMGCSLYIRRDFIDGVLLGFFLHSDCQGQYGINHIPFAEKFIDGYKLVK